MLYPIHILWELNVLFRAFPHHLNVNATFNLSCKLTPRDLNWVQNWVSRIGILLKGEGNKLILSKLKYFEMLLMWNDLEPRSSSLHQ